MQPVHQHIAQVITQDPQNPSPQAPGPMERREGPKPTIFPDQNSPPPTPCALLQLHLKPNAMTPSSQISTRQACIVVVHADHDMPPSHKST